MNGGSNRPPRRFDRRGTGNHDFGNRGFDNRRDDRRGFDNRGSYKRDDVGGEYIQADEIESIEGRNAVTEALRAGTPLDKVYVLKGEANPAIARIASLAREAGAVVVDADKRKLDAMSRTRSHQGVIATLPAVKYAEVQDILDAARGRGEVPLVIICDEISDPHNLGAIIRTAEACGAHGVIVPKRRSAGLTSVVAKTSAGAAFHLPTARVTNITDTIKSLRDAGLWIYAASPEGEKSLWETELTGPAAIVIGSEGRGIGRLISENCDFFVRIPMAGKLSSLNASVSAAVIMYEAARQRGLHK